MGMNMCLVCKHCDPERTNDLEQVRCKRFSTFVDALNWCDYFTNKETRALLDMINGKLRSEQNELL